MKNTVKALIVTGILSLIAGSANADQQDLIDSGAQPLGVQMSVEQSTAVSACVKRVLECGTTPETAAVPPKVRYKVKFGQASIRELLEKQAERLKDAENAIAGLEEDAKSAAADDAEIQAQIDALREQIEGLNQETDTGIQDALDQIRQGLEELGLRVAAGELKWEQVQIEYDQLLARMNRLEASLDPFEYGIYLAPNLVLATGGTHYTGVALTSQFTLRVNPAWDVIGEVSPIFAVSKAPFGTQARGAVGYRVTHTVRLELGLSSTWVEYNNQVKAKAMFLAGDLGLRYLAKNGFSVIGNLGLGSAFIANENPSFAFSGRLGVGYAR